MGKDGGRPFLGCWHMSLDVNAAACICEGAKTFSHPPW